jgi:hypothetical protein
MKVHPSHTGQVDAAHAAAKQAAPSSSTATSFAGLLANQTTAPGTDATATAPTSTTAVALRSGESMTPVAGHAYAEISGGKRDGLYINTSHNKRHGQAFVLVHKNGREYHIYGHGKDRVVVALRKRDQADSTTTAPTAGTGGVTPTVSAS